MKRISIITMGLLVVALTLFGCATGLNSLGWVTLIDGATGLDNFNRIGDANWRAEGGAIVADKGKGGYLVSKKSYKDFMIYAEFWADETTQSGVHFRASNPKLMSADNSYEANIYDQRPGAEYSTGSIVNFASVPVPAIYKTTGNWNTYEIYANGSEVTVKFNGTVTANIRDSKYKEGPIALQFGNRGELPGGPIKWRKVLVREL